MSNFITREDAEYLRGIAPTLKELRLISLKRRYSSLKKKYFGDDIPSVECIGFSYVPAKPMYYLMGEEGCYGFHWMVNNAGIPDKGVCALIAISESSSDIQEFWTLIHEMAHLKVNLKFGKSMAHGKNWQDEMKRLAGVGAFKDWW